MKRTNGRLRSCAGWRWGWLAALIAMTAGCAWMGGDDGAQVTDPAARRLARQTIRALGGRNALGRLHYLSFEFVTREAGKPVVRRKHLWDRATGRYRLETTFEGKPALALFDLNSDKGQVFVGYPPNVQATADPRALRQARREAATDTAWLLAAGQWYDPGRRLIYVGENKLGATDYPTLFLTVTHGGESAAPDKYWFFIDPASHLPQGWAFVLNGRNAPPTEYRWTQWQEIRGFKLPVQFDQVGGSGQVRIEHLYSPPQVADRVFVWVQ